MSIRNTEPSIEAPSARRAGKWLPDRTSWSSRARRKAIGWVKWQARRSVSPVAVAKFRDNGPSITTPSRRTPAAATGAWGEPPVIRCSSSAARMRGDPGVPGSGTVSPRRQGSPAAADASSAISAAVGASLPVCPRKSVIEKAGVIKASSQKWGQAARVEPKPKASQDKVET
jgi:hypothetical protein